MNLKGSCSDPELRFHKIVVANKSPYTPPSQTQLGDSGWSRTVGDNRTSYTSKLVGERDLKAALV